MEILRGSMDPYNLSIIQRLQTPNLTWMTPSKLDKNKRAVYKAKSTRPIKAGEQLFLDFGRWYFDNEINIADYQ